jgi:hypothetical protein
MAATADQRTVPGYAPVYQKPKRQDDDPFNVLSEDKKIVLRDAISALAQDRQSFISSQLQEGQQPPDISRLFPAAEDPESIIGLGYATPEGDPTATGRILLAGKKHGLFNEDNSISNKGLALLMNEDEVIRSAPREVYREWEEMGLEDLGQPESEWLRPIWNIVKNVPKFGYVAGRAYLQSASEEGVKPEDFVTMVETGGQILKDSATLIEGTKSVTGQAFVRMMEEDQVQDDALLELRRDYKRNTRDLNRLDSAVALEITLGAKGIVDSYVDSISKLPLDKQEEAKQLGQSGALAVGMIAGPELAVLKAGSFGAKMAFAPVSRQFIRAERAVQEYADTQKQLNSAKLRAAHFQSVANKVPERAAFFEKQADKFSTAGDIDRAARIRAQAEKMRGLASTSASRVASLTDEIAELERVIPGLEKAASAGDTLARVSAAAAQLKRTPFELIGAPLQVTGAALIGIDKGLRALSNKVGIGKAYDYLNKFSTVGLGGGVAAISGFGPMAFVPAAVKTTLSAGPLLNEIGKLTRTLGREGAKVRGSIPYWQRVANASVNPKTKWFAHRMSEVEWGLGKANQLTRGAVPGAVRGSIAGFPVDLGFEYIYSGGELGWEQLKNASAESIVLGGSGGAFGGISVSPRDKLIKVHNNDAINFYRELKTPDQRLAFNSLSSPMKRIVGNTSAAYPGLNIQFTNTGSGGFDTRTNTISINPSSSNPLAPLIGHEFSHYISIRNGMEPAISAILVGDGVQSGGLLRRANGTLDPDFEAWGNEYNRRLSLQHEREMSARVAAGDKISPAQREFKPLNQNQLANEYFSEVNSEDLAEMVEGGRLTQLAQRPASIQKVLSVAESLIDKSSILRDLHFKIGGMMDTKGKMVMGSGLLSEGIRQIPQMRRMYQKMVADTAGRPAYTRRISKQEAEGIEVPDTGFQDPIHDEMFSVYETDENSEVLRDENGIAIPLSSEKDQARSQAGLVLIENAAAREQSGQQVEGELKYNPDLDRWNGRFLTNEQIKILSDSGIFNSKQIRNIRTLNEVARDGSGKRFLTIYQPALEKRKGRRAVYKPKKKTMREIVPIGTSITKDGNILITLMSVKQLHANVMEMAGKKMGAKLYNGDPEAIMTDVLEVIRLHGENKSADLYFKNKPEYSADWQNRKNFINAVFGAVGKGQADFNPILNSTKAENGVVKTYRADRMNKTIALDGDTVLPYNNNLVRINYMPEGEPITDASGNIVGMGIEVPSVDQFDRNARTAIDKIKNADIATEDGATFNLDGTEFTEGALIVPGESINLTQAELGSDKIVEFMEANKDIIPPGAPVKFGIYKFPNQDKVSIDMNILVDPKHRDVALEFGNKLGQESLFDTTNFENVKTGATGDNPVKLTPEQFKTAAEYLSRGEMPLIEFDQQDSGQRLMPENLDADHLAAVERGDMETAQRIVNEVAKAADLIRSRHATGAPDFTVFSRDAIPEYDPDTNVRGFHFSNNATKQSSYRYQNSSKNRVMDVFLNLGKKISRREAEKMVRQGEETDGFPTGYDTVVFLESAGTPTKAQREAYERGEPVEMTNGYSIIKAEGNHLGVDYVGADLFRTNEPNEIITGYDGIDDAFAMHNEEHYVVRNPDQIKSADPVTRDDQGNVIPLSQRFDVTSSDIRFMPDNFIGENSDYSTPPSDDAAKNALSSSKKQFFGESVRSIGEGFPVGVRIDIPAFLDKGVYVQTVHEKATPGDVGDRIGYDTHVRLKNGVRFFVKEGSESIKRGAMAIKEGRANKHPIATVEGAFSKDRSIPQDINEWTPVGMDPKKHSYFYDKRTGDPVIGGSESYSVNNTVFVKDPVYGKRQDFRYMPEVDLNKLPENVIVPDDIDVGKEVSKGRNSILKEGDSIGTFRYLPEGFIEKFAITDQDREYLKGKSGFAFVSDWADSERKYVTKNSREIDVMYGGIGYPFIPEMQGKAAWASTRGGKIISAVAKKIESTDGVGLIVLGGKESSASSRAFSIAFTEELLDAVDNGTDVVLLNDAIKKAFIDYNDFLKSKGKKKQLPIAESITDWSNSFGGLTFEDRAALVKRIGSHNNKKSLGILSWNDVLKKYNIQNKGYAPGQIVGIVEFSKKAAMSAEEAEVPYHPSYEAVFPGRSIGTIDQKLMIGDFFKDFFEQEKTKPASYTRKVQTKMPVFTIGEGSAYLPKSTKK